MKSDAAKAGYFDPNKVVDPETGLPDDYQQT